MAVNKTIYCTECNETKQECRNNNDHSSICGKCKSIITHKERKAHFNHLDNLTTEERIRIIEKWIYDYKPSTNFYNDVY